MIRVFSFVIEVIYTRITPEIVTWRETRKATSTYQRRVGSQEQVKQAVLRMHIQHGLRRNVFQSQQKGAESPAKRTRDTPVVETRASATPPPVAALEIDSSPTSVKELTLLVEELKRLLQRAHSLNIMGGQASELWKEAEGMNDTVQSHLQGCWK